MKVVCILLILRQRRGQFWSASLLIHGLISREYWYNLSLYRNGTNCLKRKDYSGTLPNLAQYVTSNIGQQYNIHQQCAHIMRNSQSYACMVREYSKLSVPSCMCNPISSSKTISLICFSRSRTISTTIFRPFVPDCGVSIPALGFPVTLLFPLIIQHAGRVK